MATQLTNFLRKQNKLLKQQNQELKELLELNRKALQINIKDDSSDKQKKIPSLIRLLYQENSKLHAKINEMKTELETGMCQALISQQIAFASSQQQKSLTSELRDKLTKMRKQLQNRDKKINQLLKLDSEKKGIHPQTRIIEVTQMSSVTKKLKDQIFELRNQIDNKRQEIYRCKDQKQELIKLNLILTKQINQLKIISSHQSTNSNDCSRSIHNGDLTKFLNYQKKIVADQDQSDLDDEDYEGSSSQYSEDSEILVNEQQNSKQAKIEQPRSIPPSPQNIPKPMKLIPKLELGKAKQIQDLIIQKINEDSKKKTGQIKQQKYRKIENDLINQRKKTGAIMVEKIEIQKENGVLKRLLRELQVRNQSLLASQTNKKDGDQKYGNQEWQRVNGKNTETLLDICRDVTLNEVLRDVVNGQIQLQYRNTVQSYDI